MMQFDTKTLATNLSSAITKACDGIYFKGIIRNWLFLSPYIPNIRPREPSAKARGCGVGCGVVIHEGMYFFNKNRVCLYNDFAFVKDKMMNYGCS